MKKLVLLFSLALALNACKQKEAKIESKPEDIQMMISKTDTVQDCNIFNEMDTLPLAKKIIWLRQQQAEICKPEYDKCREDMHKITQKAFDDAVAAYWGTKPVKFLKIKLDDIKLLSTDVEYQNFINATADSSNNITLSAVTTFNATDIEYSVPLFYSIERLYQLDGKTLFNFTLATIDKQTKIIFSVTGTGQYYDMSLNPA